VTSKQISQRFTELPLPVPPVQDETLSSYLSRLARANRIRLDYFMEHLTGRWRQYPRPQEVSARALAMVTSRPVEVLLYALPELRGGHASHGLRLAGRSIGGHPNQQKLLCRCCRRQKLINTPVTRWQRHDQNVCLRHGLWIGEGIGIENDQMDISSCPEIVWAQRYHRRLIDRLGRPAVAFACSESWNIHLRWVTQSRFPDIRDRRFARLIGPRWRVNGESPILHAAIYPEVVALTGLLGSAYWRSLAVSTSSRDVTRFYREVGRRVFADFHGPADGFDPIRQWREAQLMPHYKGQPSKPPTTVFAANEYNYRDTY
jgi:hypothetical protein